MRDRSACPLCAVARTQREGPYFICVDCRWRWTVSITGRIYVQSAWTPAFAFEHFSMREKARLRATRLAAEAGYFNEGLPLSQLRTQGVPKDQ